MIELLLMTDDLLIKSSVIMVELHKMQENSQIKNIQNARYKYGLSTCA